MDLLTSGDTIVSRISRLNQIIQGRTVGNDLKLFLLSQDALLDALLVLHEECSQPSMAKNSFAVEFARKYQLLVAEVRSLRLNIRDFEMKKVIGRGHFGEVQVVREKKSGDIYALKTMRKSDVLSQQNITSCQDERDIMARSNSSWITQLQYAFQDKRYLYLVMEFLPGGDLLALLSQYEESFGEDMARFYLAEITLAVHSVHSMGFVHRDVKPENVLIDRTGHIKLADFGSACRINDKSANVANIAAGTPDYVCPEVLSKMNECRGGGCGLFGPECDWWSVGVCAYEMIYGRTPFSDSSLAKTYSNIVNHQKCLQFPEDSEVSKPAVNLIKGLLTTAESRLTYEQIRSHAFFADIVFESITRTRPPFIPQLKSNDDTSYFEEVEKVKPPPHTDELHNLTEGQMSARDVAFVGFTFTRSIGTDSRGLMKDDKMSTSDLHRTSSVQQSQQLAELREKCRSLEDKCAALQRDKETTKTSLDEAMKRAEREMLERKELEKSLVQSYSEVKSMKRQLDQDREDHEAAQLRAGNLLKEMQQEALTAQRLQEEQHKLDVEECQLYIRKLQSEKDALAAKITGLEKELKRLNSREIPDSGIIDKQARTIESLNSQVERQKQEAQSEAKKAAALETKLLEQAKQYVQQMDERQRVAQQDFQARLSQCEAEKAELVRSIEDLRMEVDNRRRAASNMAAMCEMDKESLRKEILRLERDNDLAKRASVEFDASYNKRLKNIEKDYEERLKALKQDSSKEERQLRQLAAQHEEKAKNLEAQLEALQAALLRDEAQSVRLCEENEERLHTITDQNLRMSLMQATIAALEDKVAALNKELEKSATLMLPKKSTPAYERPSLNASQLEVSSIYEELTPSQYTLMESEVFANINEDASNVGAERVVRVVSRLDHVPRRVVYISTSSQTEEANYVQMKAPSDQRSVAAANVMLADDESCDENEEKETAASTGKFNSCLAENSPRFKSRKGRRVVNDELKVVSTLPNRVTMSLQLQLNRMSSDSADSSIASHDVGASENEYVEIVDDATSAFSTVSSASSTYEKSGLTNGKSSILRKSDRSAETVVNGMGTKKPECQQVACQTQTVVEREKRKDSVTVVHAAVQTMQTSTDSDSCKRAHDDIVSSLMQEKAYLEARIEPLQNQITELKESVHTQRIRALDLKHELNEKTGRQDKLIEDLKAKLSVAEAGVSEMKEQVKNASDKESAQREQLQQTTQELAELKTHTNKTIATLQGEKDNFKGQVSVLQSRVKTLEGELEEVAKQTEASSSRLKKLSEENAQLKPRNYELEQEVNRLQAEKTRLKMQVDEMHSAASEKTRKFDALVEEKKQLKELCVEQERQLEMLESLLKEKEDKECTWTGEKAVYEKAVNERESETDQIQTQLHAEQMKRMKAEERERELVRQLTLLQDSHTSAVDRLNKQIGEQKARIESLNSQLKDLDCSHSMLQVDFKALERRIEQLTQENTSIKEEASKLITKVSEYKSSNHSLSKDFQLTLEQRDMLMGQKSNLENYLETMQINHQHEQFKLESTIGQQAKLIDFLQAKVENPPKKKRGLQIFGSSGQRRQDLTPVALQLREVQNSLDHERNKTQSLRRQMAQLEEKLMQQPVSDSAAHKSSGSANSSEAGDMSAGQGHMPSQSGTPRPGVDTSLAPPRPVSQRLQHNIPHRFITGINSRAVKCAVCLGTVSFVKPAAKCQECSIVCHPKCAPSLPATCGLPTQYVQHLMETIGRVRSLNKTRASAADLNIRMSDWMKVPRPGKQIWEKRWVVLEKNVLRVMADDTSSSVLFEFDLRPTNGLVMVHGGVTAAELTNTAVSDLPYIIKLELEPETTCWPGRVIYLMALTFPDKQRWVATLEAIVNDGDAEAPATEQKVHRSILLSHTSEKRMDFNCVLPLTDKVSLVGTDNSLFLLDLCRTSHPGPLRRIAGLDSAQHLCAVPGTDHVLAIAGHERELVMFSTSGLLDDIALPQNEQRPLVVHARRLEGAITCTVFALGTFAGNQPAGLFLCVATVERVILMIYSPQEGFVPKKEMLTSQACSCMIFAEKKILFGTDKFYSIDPIDYTVTEFIDRRDSSLAFAAFGAICYESFPTAVVKVSRSREPEEFLLCFNEFGVFVNGLGRRSRQGDLKWHGLPLTFAYQAPYLYIVHFSAIEVLEIMPGDSELLDGAKTFIRLSSPRLLGPGPAGSVYVGHSHNNTSEIATLKGNTAHLRLDVNKENLYSQPTNFGKSDSLKSSGSDERLQQAAVLRKMSRSPGRKLRESSTNSDVYDP